MRHIIPISGKDSLWTALFQKNLNPYLNYEYMFNDTRAELPETYQWLAKVEEYLQSPIVKIGKSLEDLIDDYNILPSFHRRFCTVNAKIRPMEDWIGTGEATVYYGIRFDESRVGYTPAKNLKIYPVYPLVDGRQTVLDVYEGLTRLNLMPPDFFWKELYEVTVDVLGKHKQKLDAISPLLKRNLFSWRSRTNCYFCFFQRQYEWIGLYDNHPELYQKACNMEELYGSENFTWMPNRVTLKDLLNRRDVIIFERARLISDALRKNDPKILEESNGTSNLINVVSCGLFCGK